MKGNGVMSDRCGAPVAPVRPNLVLIYTDQQRYDTLGSSGNTLVRTPHLDRMADEGVCFSRGYVTCPICVPSRVALWTGRENHTNLSFNNSRLLRAQECDFATQFRAHGYATALIGKNHCYPAPRLEQAFASVREAHHGGWCEPRTDAERRNRQARDGKMQVPLAADPAPAGENVTAQIFREAMAYLRNPPAQPYLLWLSIPDPHPPYMVSEPYASMYRDTVLPPPAWSEAEMRDKPYRQQLIVEWDRYEREYPGTRIDDLRRTYWGMVSCIDDHVGRLLDELRTSGQADHTLVLFTSDHGDYMGDHRMIRKGVNLYEALVHVPYIAWGCGCRARRTAAMVNNLDVLPTFAEFAGVPVPAVVQGRSFAAVLRGDRDTHREMVFLEHGDPGRPLRPGDLSSDAYARLASDSGHHLCREISRGRTKGARTDRYKYCFTPGDVDELYDRCCGGRWRPKTRGATSLRRGRLIRPRRASGGRTLCQADQKRARMPQAGRLELEVWNMRTYGPSITAS
jgi:arylsulfatase A-like enzyme